MGGGGEKRAAGGAVNKYAAEREQRTGEIDGRRRMDFAPLKMASQRRLIGREMKMNEPRVRAPADSFSFLPHSEQLVSYRYFVLRQPNGNFVSATFNFQKEDVR